MKTLRKATIDDVDALVTMAHDTFESCFPVPVDKSRASEIVKSLIFAEGSFKIAEDDGRVCGFFAATISRIFPWAGQPVAFEVLFFVAPEFRKSRVAVMLIADFIEWAKASECSLAIMSSRAELDGSRVGKFYERFGFKPLDTNYVLKIDQA